MSKTIQRTATLFIAALAVQLAGCDEEPKPEPKAKPSAAPVVTSAPVAAKPPPPKKPSHECPKDSEGFGSFDKPCKAEGTNRIMEVTWNNKPIKEKGPTFRVISKSDLEIKYGKVFVYFYDKAGKLMEVESNGKKKKRLSCPGRIFAGAVKPKEKIFVNFSCVKQKHVPADFKTIEAEIQMVGFTAKDGGKVDTYWRNEDLVPDDRPKGGIKKKK